MKTTRALLTGSLIWILGVSVFLFSFSIPILSDPELQANLALAISLGILAWLGAKFYYSKKQTTSGYKLAFFFVLIAVVLDALITVPYLIIPHGGSYLEFFTAPGFWLIATEYFLVVVLYWYVNVKPVLIRSNG